MKEEPLITPNRIPQLKSLLESELVTAIKGVPHVWFPLELQEKLAQPDKSHYYLHKVS